MNVDIIKSYCQFCLKQQTKDHPKIPINRVLKQNFQELTQLKLNTVRYSEFICCEPCYQEFEYFVAYREGLLKNQETLEELFRKKSLEPTINDPQYLEIDEDENVTEDTEIEVVKAEVNDTETLTICEGCHEEINESEVDHHVCPPLRTEEELDSSADQTMNDSQSKKKRYPKKRLKDPISCPKCDRKFFYKAYFQFHFKDVHRNDREEICQFCGKVFKNSRRLNSHILIHQKDAEKKFKCDKCEKQFNFSGDLVRHKRVHENIKPYSCHLCPKSFAQSYALRLHINVHNKVKYTCDICASNFSSKPTLKRHMLKCVNGIAVTRTSRGAIDRERYKCFSAGCERQFSSRKYLGIHMEKSHGMKFDCWETTCLECQLVFETAGDYSVHVKTHSCNFVCELCKLRFKTEAKLHIHREKLHKEGEDRPFVCIEENCGARFKRSEHLRGHVLYKHSDERKFECNLCDLKFRQRGEFNVHMRVHMNYKPFSCWKCNHVCKTSSNLRQHMSLVHNETCIYFCKICHKTFRYNTDLTQHKKDHSTAAVVDYEVVDEIEEINEQVVE